MLRQILKQIWTLRRRNAWLFAEMLIIFVLSAILMDYFFALGYNHLLPQGFDDSNTYMVSTIDFNRAASGEGKDEHDAIVTKTRAFPGVLHILETGQWGLSAHTGSYNGTSIQRDSTSAEYYSIQRKRVDAVEYFDVFVTPSVITGKPARLDLSDNRQCILTENIAKTLFGDENPIGQEVFCGDYYRVVDVVREQKRLPNLVPNSVIFMAATKSQPIIPMLSIRVGDNFDLERFKAEVTPNIQSLQQVQTSISFSYGHITEARVRSGIMVFMLCNIALTVIGTFWLRNQKRRSEIGLRIALGSSRLEVQRLYILESLLILVLAALPALLINVVIYQADIVPNEFVNPDAVGYITSHKWWRFSIVHTLTILLLGLITAFSAWIPARKAAALSPVDALRTE